MKPIVVGTVLSIAALVARQVEAQRVQPEIRFEALGPNPYQGLLGLALHFPAGRYVRVGLGGTGFAIGRADLIARFTFDPYRQQQWALSIGGGLSRDYDRGLFLAVHSDLEGPLVAGPTPFVSAGLAGGPRFAIGVRRGFRNRR